MIRTKLKPVPSMPTAGTAMFAFVRTECGMLWPRICSASKQVEGQPQFLVSTPAGNSQASGLGKLQLNQIPSCSQVNNVCKL